ncbi:hypothetical protein L211DRAFT_842734 [Terfezia boudieri ATCC MYA-4762]|uniref:Uncharacterized protein n=1 Tax=Terfezia boudieri ATCC MYA-4762 TaxID=1051890 RepID=A0A3N4L9M3_9PEZI|nr:hypothetical protein L211DRAFT_842734 [Terfezia boudieri ATCC MYA-4762]
MKKGNYEKCNDVLEDLDKLRIKYMSLGSAQGSSAQAIDRIKWSKENIVELRARLTCRIPHHSTDSLQVAHMPR